MPGLLFVNKPANNLVTPAMNSDKQKLKDFLESKVGQYNSIRFIETDPISIPHLFNKKEDVEIAGFMAATIAWGQRTTIISNAKKLMQWMDGTPHDFIMNFSEKDLLPFNAFVHRTFNSQDCIHFLWALKNLYQNYGGLENAFCSGFSSDEADTKNAILLFRQRFLQLEHPQRIEKHLANPDKKSSAKRLNMFLRWMVRTDNKGVDFGIWKQIKPAQLICPLDVHSGRVARKLGLLDRMANDWQAAEELSQNLRRFDPNDPIKYDYALFGLGVFEKY